MSEPDRRHSAAEDPELVGDPAERAQREAANGLRQFDQGLQTIEQFVRDPERKFRLRPSLILDLHRAALEGLSPYAGLWRPAQVDIQGSRHNPPGTHLVPSLIEEMCDYVNDHWSASTPVHLAAYLMWRLNWIHPFTDGNGRTSRMLSYVVLCVRSGLVLPGARTIPEQITENRNQYFEALEAADAAASENKVDVSKMEHLLEAYLAAQLVEALRRATGREPGRLPM